MLESAIAIPFWVELLATVTGAISGSMHAVKHNYDFFGVVCLACITGLAGGIIRDVLLQNYGIYAFQRWELIMGCVLAAVPVFFFCRLLEKLDLPMDIIDTISVALYAVLGAGKGYAAGQGVLVGVILGTITAVGGGLARDMLLARQPKVFLSGPMYASAATAGALVYLLMRHFDVLPTAAPWIGVALIIILRFGSVFLHIETKPARDYSDKAEELAKRFVVWFRKYRHWDE